MSGNCLSAGREFYSPACFFLPIPCFYLQNAPTYTKINIKVAESGSKWFEVGDIPRGRALEWAVFHYAAFSGR